MTQLLLLAFCVVGAVAESGLLRGVVTKPENAVACLTMEQCKHTRLGTNFDRVYVNSWPTKGCFSKRNNLYFGTGGSVEMMSKAKLPGIQKRIWCERAAKEPTATDSNVTVNWESTAPSDMPLRPIQSPPTSPGPATSEPSKSPTSHPSAFPTSKPTESPTTPSPTPSPSFDLQTFATTFQSNTTFAGNMFDIVARKNIAIYNMGIHTYLQRDIDLQIYTRVGSYQGAQNDISRWTHVVNTTVRGQGMGNPTMLSGAFSDPIFVRRGSRQSFYVTTNGPWLRATKGTNQDEEMYQMEDSDMSFYQGVGKRYPMNAGTYPARIWNGLLQYRVDEIGELVDWTTMLGEVTFRRGDLAVRVPDLGIKVCTGMNVKVIARANKKLELADGSFSDLRFHSMPDGAAIFPTEDAKYIYVSNSEMKNGLGGVYGVVFDNDGNVVDYKLLLSGTTRNCGGGYTPWHTWITCEEYGRGQCWQVHPNGKIPPQITKLGGNPGGNYESVAVDNRNPHQPIFYVTEDHERGALRKYTPTPAFRDASWDTLHAEGGTTEYLVFVNDNEFKWTANEGKARESQAKYFRNVEGIDYHDGMLYFVSKKLLMLYILDLDNGTYKKSSTKYGVLAGDGEFRHQPDQLVRNNAGDYLYLTEDGGGTVGCYAIHKPTGRRYAIFEAYGGSYRNDETTGLAFSLDGSKMYAAFQDCGCDNSDGGVDYNCGCLMEFSRKDGRSFDGSALGL
ncbi:hypothetical protein ACHAXR_006623 [Thalassiosira sp. AJA248-18]